MTDYEIYVFFLCAIVFTLLATLSVICITIIARLTVRLIRSGADDERILEEHRKRQAKKPNKFLKAFDYTFTGIVCFVFAIIFVGSFFVSCTEEAHTGDLSTYRVVRTGSMAYKNPQNTYLVRDNVNDHIQTFDLIRTEKMPDEMELELYDIVVYEVDEILVVHRIVGIEEPNEEHPDCRHFRLQGDAVAHADRFPVKYEQMRAIYRGVRVPFIGSFILFMQSPAGWLCMLLIVVGMIASPVLDNYIEKEKQKRLLLIEVGSSDD